MDKPVLFLDVDGVLNALGAGPPEGSWADFAEHRLFTGHAWHQGRGIRLLLSAEMGAALAALPCELRWLTTWGPHAPVHVAPLVGLPAMPVTCEDQDPVTMAFTEPWWKLTAVRDHFETTGRRFVWVDDEIASRTEAVQWLASIDDGEPRARPGGPYLAISPQPGEGLTPAQVGLIAEFCGAAS